MKRTGSKTSSPAFLARPVVLIFGLAVCFAGLFFPARSFAQPAIRIPGAGPEQPLAQAPARIASLMVTYLPNRATTRLSEMGTPSYRADRWMRILIQFSTEPRWMDEIRFDCFVLIREGNRRTMLSGSVTCIYVQAARRHYAALFVPPNVIERYGGRVEAVGVECSYENAAVSDYSVPGSARKWWQDYTGVPDAMVTWSHTPFLRDGVENYEQIKAGRQGL